MSKTIALSEPYLHGDEWPLIKQCLDTGWVSTAGKFVDSLEKQFVDFIGGKYAVAVNSGTAALHMALNIAGVQPGDEVLVPTVTFIAPVNAVTYVGAQSVFMDCDDHYNIDPAKVATFLDEQTVVRKGYRINKSTGKRIRAIIPVHVFGNAVALDRLLPLCRKNNIKVIEDATESLGTVYRGGRFDGRHPGTLGDIGCFSFNGNKIITAGGGGMLVTRDKDAARKAKYLTNQAKDDALFYIHNEVGYNYRLNNIQAAFATAQLKNLEKVLKKKQDIFERYRCGIDGIEGLTIDTGPTYAQNSYWLIALRVQARRYGRSRDELLDLFLKESIQVRPLWQLNHLQKPYRKCQTYKIDKANHLIKETLNLPSHFGMSEADVNKIVRCLKKWKK